MELLKTIAALLPLIKEKKPLIHHITNYVTVNDCANITLAIGACPIMAIDPREVDEVVSQASALVLNTGTITPATVGSMLLAGKRANILGVPVILDPVGVGVSRLRRKAVGEILTKVKISVLKGNAAEITFLSGLEATFKGVDAVRDSGGKEKACQNLAQKLGCVVALTGRRDILTDGENTYYIENGQPMLTKITGTGCMASSLVAAFCAVTGNYLQAALGGLLTMGIASEIAYQRLKASEGPGTFKSRLFDAVFTLTPAAVQERGLVITPEEAG